MSPAVLTLPESCRLILLLYAQVARPENAARFEHVSLGEYLHSNGYSDAFIHNYILPMCAAVWSMPSSKVTPAYNLLVYEPAHRTCEPHAPCAWIRDDLGLCSWQ